ncbi:cell division protein CrgA [Corynebacterium poyangense]|uniref:Cell division protein CrgA n=1 Tax=Corynebacterium poyangense TaxID=2684405 RepID=A0A7H0SKZ3_9CORY|nr:cell division protein CrgA [Corynebacterium poyangense]MBZ8177302.1 cell division protein CrgA [Corynebacterium poyangense]QNQ89218.1 cell division protein CrgA [Corynebacterium poyangense]
MPKSKITKNEIPLHSSSSSSTERAPIKVNAGGTPTWYMALMFFFMLAGLAWIIVNYLAGNQIPLMVQLGPWNYAVGFGLLVIGLLMTMGWR